MDATKLAVGQDVKLESAVRTSDGKGFLVYYECKGKVVQVTPKSTIVQVTEDRFAGPTHVGDFIGFDRHGRAFDAHTDVASWYIEGSEY